MFIFSLWTGDCEIAISCCLFGYQLRAHFCIEALDTSYYTKGTLFLCKPHISLIRNA